MSLQIHSIELHRTANVFIKRAIFRALGTKSHLRTVSCLVYQSLSGQALAYSGSADEINIVSNSGRPLLQSAADRIYIVPYTHSSFGVKSFGVAGPHMWNSLTSSLIIAQ